MGYHIYESHMGGLYSSIIQIDYKQLYCDQCGDSDTYLGYAANMEDAWNLLKDKTDTFDDSICETCPHNENYDYCNNHCEGYLHSGGYNLGYVMNFLVSTFGNKGPNGNINYNYKEKVHCIYLIPIHEDDKNWIFTKVSVEGYAFGEKHALLVSKSIKKEYIDKIARDASIIVDETAEDFKEIYTEETDNEVIHIITCICRKNEMSNKNWKDAAGYHGDGWYGYVNINDLKLSINESNWLDIIKKEVQRNA